MWITKDDDRRKVTRYKLMEFSNGHEDPNGGRVFGKLKTMGEISHAGKQCS